MNGLPTRHSPFPSLDSDLAMLAKAVRKSPERSAALGRIQGTMAQLERDAERAMRSNEAALATTGAEHARADALKRQLDDALRAIERLQAAAAKRKARKPGRRRHVP